MFVETATIESSLISSVSITLCFYGTFYLFDEIGKQMGIKMTLRNAYLRFTCNCALLLIIESWKVVIH